MLRYLSTFYSLFSPTLPHALVSDLDQVVAQLLHRIGRRPRLHALRVMRNQYRLRRFHDHHALSTLHKISALHHLSTAFPSLRPCTAYLLPVNTPIVRLEHHKPLPRDVQPRGLHLLDALGAFVLVRRHHLLHLLRRDGEAAAGRPDAVALAVEDGRPVEVAGADEAVRCPSRLVAQLHEITFRALLGGEIPLVHVGYTSIYVSDLALRVLVGNGG